jgi:hypothetical protein
MMVKGAHWAPSWHTTAGNWSLLIVCGDDGHGPYGYSETAIHPTSRFLSCISLLLMMVVQL